MILMLRLLLLSLLLASQVEAGTITRPTKSFGGTAFINNVIPQASDFNGDIDTVYSEFNGNIVNANINASAAIAGSKLTPAFTTETSVTTTAPCLFLDESDQAADAKRWYACVSGGNFSLTSKTDAGVLQNTWLSITRTNGSFTIGGTSGTNTVNGATTFAQAVTFSAGTSLLPTGTVQMYMGTSAPSGWLLMDGSSSSCTTYSALCTQLVGLYGTANYKGTASLAVTVDASSDEVLHVAHGKSANTYVHFTSTTTLPAGLSATVAYCIISVTTDRYKISTTCGGSAVDITSTGTGTHSDYFNFLTPDMRGRSPVGTGTGSGLTARTIGATAGSETISTAMMPSHSHTISITDPGHAHTETGDSSGGAFNTVESGGGSSGSSSNSTSATASNTTGISASASSTGSGAADGNFQPSIVITFVIKT